MKDAAKWRFWIWRFLPFVGLMLWGVFCVNGNLWYDEAYSAAMVSLPWTRMIYITAIDAHSPFYYVLLKLVYLLFGEGTRFWSLKLCSVLFMTGYLLLGKYYVKKLFGESISIWFMVFSILMPIMTVQAGNVRMYALALFSLTLTGLSAYDIWLQETRRKWIVFCIASICTVYSHTFALIQTFLFYMLLFGVFLYKKQYDKVKKLFRCGLVVAVVFSPWLLVTCRQFLLRMKYDTGSVSVHPDRYVFIDYCAEWFSALETPIGLVIFLGMGLAVVLGYCAVDWMREKNNFTPAVGMGALGLTILAGVLISVYINNCFLGRYAFPGFGFLMLFYAVGMDRIASRKVKVGLLAVAVLCFLLQYRSEVKLEYDRGLVIYEEFWENQVTDEDVMIGPFNHTIFLNVYHPDLRYYLSASKPYNLPFANTEFLEDIGTLRDVKGNIWWIDFAGGRPEQLEAYYEYEETVKFHYMYYDFVIYKLTNR